MMNLQRFAVAALLSVAALYASARVIGFAGPGSAGPPTNGAAQLAGRLAPSLAVNVPPTQTLAAAVPAPARAPAATAAFEVGTAELETAAELLAQVAVIPKAQGKLPASDAPAPVVVAALGNPGVVLPEAAPRAATGEIVGPSDEANNTAAARPRLELVGECMDAEACINQYLFALYERTPKEDTIRRTERWKVAAERKGKTVTVTHSVSWVAGNDFTWKDPKAAERADMSMIDYVIGGMDKSFKLKLFYMLQAAENAGLQPGITSAFRDDYRQSIASGLKAARDKSYHGGSSRGGYGHGMAADLVSVNGANRAERRMATEGFWKWIDANGKQYGIGRPYLGHDPPHVGPIDGEEYVSRRGGAKVADVAKRSRQVEVVKKKRGRQVAHRYAAAKPPRAQALGPRRPGQML